MYEYSSLRHEQRSILITVKGLESANGNGLQGLHQATTKKRLLKQTVLKTSAKQAFEKYDSENMIILQISNTHQLGET